MDKKIDFYQEVAVCADAVNSRYRGLKGVVLGISEEGGIVYGYAVMIHGENNVIYFDGDELMPTGVCFKRGDFY